MRPFIRFEWCVEDVVAWVEVAVAIATAVILIVGAR
jgi:hypothetical protein